MKPGRMSLERQLAAAARNNATWCDALCRAHGAPGEFVPGAWLNRRPAPRFYPNLVTLEGPEHRDRHRAAIRELITAPPAESWAAKDSFAVLDLTPLGLALLFEAAWIHRPAGAFDSDSAACRVTRADQLARWERAWAGGAMAAGDRLFPAALLAEADHAVIALEQDGAIVAGCIASRSDGVLGISNLFAPDDEDCGRRAACLAAALRVAPELPLVGYEHGADLARMKMLGFAEIGCLRVWQAAG